jgi:secondary thiamine-phosphate synthase enzyme
MASSILGPSLTIPVAAGKLVLGTWQSVMLVELDGPRERTVRVTLVPS